MDWNNQKVLVIGLARSGQAATELLLRRGARVLAVDGADSEGLRRAAEALRARGAEVRLGVNAPLAEAFDLAVISPGVPCEQPIVRDLAARGVPVISELELGFQMSRCPCVAITGTNGKTTTTELVERVLNHCGRRTVAAGNIGQPVCAVAEQTGDLDWLTLEVSSFQLETIRHFRPLVSVLLNLTPDHFDRYAGMADYLRAKARIFMNQQAMDWAVIQSEALDQLKALGLAVPERVITFSAADGEADLYLERGVINSRIEGWSGTLLDLRQCRLRGPHNAENMMATLAVGWALRLSANAVTDALKSYQPAPHRCELVAEIAGVQYVNDSKATNVDAVIKAVQTMPQAASSQPNIWLIAGGKDKGFDFDSMGPLLSQRVKGVYLIGEMRHKMRAAWQFYTRCELAEDLVSALQHIVPEVIAGDVVLLSPACSSFDQFRDYQHRGEVFREAVLRLQNTTDSGCISRQTQHNDGGSNETATTVREGTSGVAKREK